MIIGQIFFNNILLNLIIVYSVNINKEKILYEYKFEILKNNHNKIRIVTCTMIKDKMS